MIRFAALSLMVGTTAILYRREVASARTLAYYHHCGGHAPLAQLRTIKAATPSR